MDFDWKLEFVVALINLMERSPLLFDYKMVINKVNSVFLNIN